MAQVPFSISITFAPTEWAGALIVIIALLAASVAAFAACIGAYRNL